MAEMTNNTHKNDNKYFYSNNFNEYQGQNSPIKIQQKFYV